MVIAWTVLGQHGQCVTRQPAALVTQPHKHSRHQMDEKFIEVVARAAREEITDHRRPEEYINKMSNWELLEFLSRMIEKEMK